ncbi:hypothetical protein UlMin_039629 [Ulmus minor]
MASSNGESKLAAAKAFLTTAASIAGTAMLVRSFAQDLIPHEIQDSFFSVIRNSFSRFSQTMTMVIDEYEGLVSNQIYGAAEIYLGSKVSPSTNRLRVSKPEKEKNFVISMERNEIIVDVFNGAKFTWIKVCQQVQSKNFNNYYDFNSTLRSEVRAFELSFHKKHLDLVMETYLPYIVEEAKSMEQEKKTLRIFTVDYENIYGNLADAWLPTNLDHPATFDTLALDLEIKNFILEDLERFSRRKDYYKKIGKAWKRGYLLYGPPGTGKSSLIAAMANYMNFDIYDLELTELRSNSDLRKLLISMANRSILVVEDIDCSVEFKDRLAAPPPSHPSQWSQDKQVTLSGLLNFIDGLWSTCGDERIIIFTTNHKERLDPALLRPGRMDVHVHMSYCTPCGFSLLASNYLGIKEHQLFAEIEQLMLNTEVTPAEVAEQLLKSNDPDLALRGLIEFLHARKKEKEEAKAKKEQEQEAEAKAKGDELKQAEVALTQGLEQLSMNNNPQPALSDVMEHFKEKQKENGEAKAKANEDKQEDEAMNKKEQEAEANGVRESSS